MVSPQDMQTASTLIEEKKFHPDYVEDAPYGRNNLRAGVRLLIAVIVIGFFALLLSLMTLLQLPMRRYMTHYCFKLVAKIMNLKLNVTGEVTQQRPVIFVANHSSYLDIIALGALLPSPFVSKQEVGQWPVIGFISKVGGTAFIDRNPRKVRDNVAHLKQKLQEEKSMVVFPEGTTTDGNRIGAFHNSMFALAEAIEEPVPIQPIAIAYTRINNIPVGRFYRPLFAWYGDMELADHLWEILSMRSVTVDIKLLPPIHERKGMSRKQMAETSEKAVASAFQDMVTRPSNSNH